MLKLLDCRNPIQRLQGGSLRIDQVMLSGCTVYTVLSEGVYPLPVCRSPEKPFCQLGKVAENERHALGDASRELVWAARAGDPS